MTSDKNTLILFDGICNLCNSLVRFVIKRDPKKKFRFASLQSEIGQKLLVKYKVPVNSLETFVLIKNDVFYLRSSAILILLKELGGGWKLFYVLRAIPKSIRDAVYNFIAKRRYKMFGKRDYCLVPDTELKERFL